MMNDLEDGAVLDAPKEFQSGRVRDWTWSPRYAKVWWALAGIFWAAKVAAYRLTSINWLNEPGAAGYLTVAFFPPLMLLIFGFGRVKARISARSASYTSGAFDYDLLDRPIGPSGLPVEVDPLDPRSGSLWIGSRLNPLHPASINREI